MHHGNMLNLTPYGSIMLNSVARSGTLRPHHCMFHVSLKLGRCGTPISQIEWARFRPRKSGRF
jgi:hypothetical protein